MAGIFAIATHTRYDSALTIAEDLAEKMVLYPWQRKTLCPIPGSGIIMGAVFHEGPNGIASNWCLQEGPLTAVVDGYFIRSLSGCGADAHIRSGQYAQAALAAYRKFGADFPAYLEGAFVTIIHDAEQDVLVSGNGHFANPHLYHYVNDAESIYCSQLGPMAGCRFFQPEADNHAIGRLMTDGAFSGTETFFESVSAIKLASIVHHSLLDNKQTSRVYWTFGNGEVPEHGKSFAQHTSELCDAITAAGDRITSRDGRYVAGLSGGLDSRLVAAVAARSCPGLKSWTFGTPDSPDMIIASQISDKLGLEHLTYPTHPELVPSCAAEYALTVDGSISSDFAYGLERTRNLMQHGDIVLNGLAGEAILGDYLIGPNLMLLKTQMRDWNIRDSSLIDHMLGRNMTNDQVAHFMALKAGSPSSLAPYVVHRPRPIEERIREQLDNLPPGVSPPYRRENQILSNRVTRWTIMGIISDRHFYSDGSIFYDYEVIDRCMATPHSMRSGNRLYSAVFRTLLPEVAGIPNANNGLRADVSPGRVAVGKIARAIYRKWSPIKVANPATGNNPDGWSRNLYPDYYRELLADKRTLGRQFWDGPGIANLTEKHLAGEVNLGTPLGLLASVEYFWRKWVD